MILLNDKSKEATPQPEKPTRRGAHDLGRQGALPRRRISK